MNDPNGTNGTGQQVSMGDLSNETLMDLYEKYDANSAAFAQVKEEMLRRGFKFEAAGEPAPEVPTGSPNYAQVQPAQNQGRRLRYSEGGSAVWIGVYVVLGLALFGLLSGIFEDNDKPNTMRIVSSAAGAILLFTLGALVAGVRKLANRRNPGSPAIPDQLWLILLGSFWVLAGLAGLFYAAKLFIDAVEWDVGMALGIAAVPLMLTIGSAALATALLNLAKEISARD